MTIWIDVIDQLPPRGMDVLVWAKDIVNGWTEDFCVSGRCIGSEEKENHEADWVLYGIGNASTQEHIRITHWTLMLNSPHPIKN